MLCRPTAMFCRFTSFELLRRTEMCHILRESCFVLAMVWGRSQLSAFADIRVPVSAKTKGGTL